MLPLLTCNVRHFGFQVVDVGDVDVEMWLRLTTPQSPMHRVICQTAAAVHCNQSQISPLSSPLQSFNIRTHLLISRIIHPGPSEKYFRDHLSFSRWTWVSRYQNVSILDFIGAKGDGGGGNNWNVQSSQLKYHHQQTNTQFLTGRMPFLSPNRQCQSTEGRWDHVFDREKYFSNSV